MTASEALKAASSHGVAIRLKPDGSGLILEADAEPPPDVLEALRAAKPDLLRVLAGRDAAKAAFDAKPPPNLRLEAGRKPCAGSSISLREATPIRGRCSDGRMKNSTTCHPSGTGSISPGPRCSSAIVE